MAGRSCPDARGRAALATLWVGAGISPSSGIITSAINTARRQGGSCPCLSVCRRGNGAGAKGGEPWVFPWFNPWMLRARNDAVHAAEITVFIPFFHIHTHGFRLKQEVRRDVTRQPGTERGKPFSFVLLQRAAGSASPADTSHCPHISSPFQGSEKDPWQSSAWKCTAFKPVCGLCCPQKFPL